MIRQPQPDEIMSTVFMVIGAVCLLMAALCRLARHLLERKRKKLEQLLEQRRRRRYCERVYELHGIDLKYLSWVGTGRPIGKEESE